MLSGIYKVVITVSSVLARSVDLLKQSISMLCKTRVSIASGFFLCAIASFCAAQVNLIARNKRNGIAQLCPTFLRLHCNVVFLYHSFLVLTVAKYLTISTKKSWYLSNVKKWTVYYIKLLISSLTKRNFKIWKLFKQVTLGPRLF